VVASDGSLLVADTNNHCLRSVTLHGTVSTVAGGDEDNFEDDFTDGVGTATRFCYPWGIVMDWHSTIYVSDYGNDNHCIRKVAPSD